MGLGKAWFHRRSTAAAFAGGLVMLALPTGAVAADQRSQDSWIVRGPADSGLAADVRLRPEDGTLSLSVSRQGRQVLAPAPLGLTTASADLTRGLSATGQTRRVVRDEYEMTTGKQKHRSVEATETTLSFTGSGGARLDVVLRIAEDGVAYRYVLPGAGGKTVTGEASAFTPPPDATAWLLPYNPQYENERVETTAASAPWGEYGNPSLFQVGQDFVLISESDVDGSYSGSRLRHDTGSSTYRVQLADERVSVSGRAETPWRTVIVGDLPTVTQSTLVDDLADPSRIPDTSWVEPGKVAWSWLSEHESPSNFERQKRYVDFASANGWPYVLVDEGWSDQWIPKLARYAAERDVELLLWFHWESLDTQRERDSVLPEVKDWGVRGVKVDFMESDTQARYRWYDQILADTAELQLMINFHGSTIPHGLARTWPHVMTMEAIHGQEQLPRPDNNPVHPFTRNVVGSMDFTPVALEVGPRTSSVAHEVALPVAYESGWQHFADMPEAYQRFPNALRFLNQLPTVWDETRLLGGHPGDDAILARRSADRWFVGGIAAGGARTLETPLDFLGEGEWLLELVTDAEGAPGDDVQRTSSTVDSSGALSVDVPTNGGFAAIICPARPQRETCDEPIQGHPSAPPSPGPA